MSYDRHMHLLWAASVGTGQVCGVVWDVCERLRGGDERMSDEYDTTEKVERTDTGFRLTVESTRGTGTRDQDKVKAELRTEEIPTEGEIDEMMAEVKHNMDELRNHQPDQ